MEQAKKKEKERSSASWIMEFAGQKKSYYIMSVLVAIMGSLCHIVPFIFMADVINKLLEHNTSFEGYVFDCAMMALFWALRVIFHGISTSLSHVATFNVLGNIRKRALLKLERMPLGDVRRRGSGDLKNVLVERIDSIETTLAHVIPEVSGNVCVTIAIIVYLFVIDWRMALVSLITLPIGMLCFCLMMIGYDEGFGRTVRATKNLNDTAVEYIGGIEVIKVFGKAKSSYEKFVAAAKEGAASYVDWMRKCNVSFTFAMCVTPATMVTVLPIGGLFLQNGSLAVNDFILIVILALGLVTPIIGCMSYEDDIAKLNLVLGEVTSILTAKDMERPESSGVSPVDNSISLKDVHFGYEEDVEVLHGVNADFEAGTVNAIVGPSGGGKSTIAKLIASFWDVTGGAIEIGGINIKDLPQNSYHNYIAYVSQENFLFDDTIRENIRMGNLGASDAEVEQAAKDCGCYDFIMSLEDGFDTRVGGGGSHLSGGEQQRICIARAMLKNAPIIILDEATAYTDPENEAIIQQSVARLVQGKTLIIIAHRLSTIVSADQILVVKDGTIDGRGTHEELLTSCPLYKNLWNAHISAKDSLDGGEAHV